MTEFYSGKLKTLRKSQKINIEKTAHEIGVTRVTYWRWESGKNLPTDDQIRKLAKIFNISISEISSLQEETKHSSAPFSKIVNSWHILANSKEKQLIEQEEKLIDIIKNRNNELRQASILIRTILSSIDTLFYFKDINHRYITANDAFLLNVSLPLGYIIQGKKDEDIFSLAEAKLNYEQDKDVLISGRPILRMEQYIPGSRKKKMGLLSKVPVFDSDGNIAGLVGTFIDITERTIAEKRRSILEKTINKSEDLFWIAKYDEEKTEFNYLFLSDSYKDIYGISEAVKGSPDYICKTYDINSEIHAEIEKHKTFPFEKIYALKKCDDTEITVCSRVFKLPEDSIFYGVTKDISDKIQLMEKEKLLSETLEHISEAFIVKDLEQNRYLYINRAFERLIGISKEDFLRSGDLLIDKVIHKDDRERIKSYVHKREWPEKTEFRIIDSSNQIKHISFSSSIIKYNERSCQVSVIRDVTSEKRITELFGLLEAHMSFTDSGIIVSDFTSLQYISKNIAHIYGYSYDEVWDDRSIDYWMNNLVYPDDRPMIRKCYETHSFPPKLRYRIIRADGAIRWVQADGTVLEYFGKKCGVSIIRDLTPEAEAEEKAAMLENILDSLPDAIISVNKEKSKIIFANSVAEKLLESSKKELCSMSFESFLEKYVKTKKINPELLQSEKERINASSLSYRISLAAAEPVM